jgi:hypothetical protein
VLGQTIARDAPKAMRGCPLLIISGLYLVAFSNSASAQSIAASSSRAVKITVKPEYSAKVQVAPDGKIKRAHDLGGHPVAVDAEEAALLTEFEPGPKETTQILEFHFGSSN